MGLSQEEVNKIIVEKGEGGCWHDYQQAYRWGILSHEWSFDQAESLKHRPTTPGAGHFKGSLYCTKCRTSIIQAHANPDFAKWENFGKMLKIASDIGTFIILDTVINKIEVGLNFEYYFKYSEYNQIPSIVSAELARVLEEKK